MFKGSNGEAQFDFEGKLSFSWPQTPQQQANKGDENYSPLFGYGYGLTYAEPQSDLGSLSEDNGSSGTELTARPLYQGTVKAPWQLAAVDSNGQQVMSASVLNTQSINVRTRDRRVQEDSLQLVWLAESAFGLYSPFPDDLMGYQEAGANIRFDVNVDSVGSSAQVKVICMDACSNSVDVTDALKAAEGKGWTTINIPMSCIAEQGVNFSKIMSPFALHAEKGTKLQISDLLISSSSEDDDLVPEMCRGQ